MCTAQYTACALHVACCMYTAYTLPGIGGQRTTVCARFDQPGQRAKAAGALRPAACALLHIYCLYTRCTAGPPVVHLHHASVLTVDPPQVIYAACARHVHGMCTACAQHVHGMCTACARHVNCLQVALARRQCWVRAFQLGPILGLLSYSTCVLVEAAGVVKLPRGSRTGVRTAAWP